MVITREKLNERVVQFVQGVLVPEARSRWTKFALGFALGTGSLGLTDKLADGLRALGVMTDAGIDVDRLKAAVYRGLDMSGGLPVDALNIVLDRPDVDKFFRLLETGAVE